MTSEPLPPSGGDAFPSQARVVVIGGGIVGASVLFHLTERGWKDVVLLERKTLTSGTTWHAAGLVGQLRATYNMSLLASYAKDLFRELERRTGARRVRAHGLPADRLHRGALGGDPARGVHGEPPRRRAAPGDAAARSARCGRCSAPRAWWAAAFIPGDGTANPTDVTQAMAQAARLAGARVFEHTKVLGVDRRDGRVSGVRTDRGDIACDVVVNCTGMWARELAGRSDVVVPLHAAEHFYLVTEPIEGLHPDLPVLRMPDDATYARNEAGKLMVGFFEPGAKPWATHGIPEDAEFLTLPEDWDHLEPWILRATKRLPVFGQVGIQLFFNGPESFTPDDRYVLGEAPGVPGYFVAAGFNSVGFASGGGAGTGRRGLGRRRPRADGPVGGRHPALPSLPAQPALPATSGRPRPWASCTRCTGRTGRSRRRGACGAPRSTTAWPPGGRASARSPAGSARTGTRPRAWSRATSTATGARTGSRTPRRSTGRSARPSGCSTRPRSGRSWSRAATPSASSTASARDRRRGARPDRLHAVVNERGGIESDVTVTRLADDRFMVVTTGASTVRDLDWLRRTTTLTRGSQSPT